MAKSKRTNKRHKPVAATKDVLGTIAPEPPIKPKWRPHYKRLTALREALLHRQGDLTKDALEEHPTFSTHMADAGTDHYDRDFALGMLSSEQGALYQIEQALDRIRNAAYGIRELTGKPIEPQRLEAIPWTRFSAAAEKQLEKEGAFNRTRLGPRETVARSSEPEEKEEDVA